QHGADSPNSKGLFMKRLALAFALTVGAASAALAADLPTPGPIPPPIYAPTVAYNWTGFYIGGNLGLGWNGGSFADSIGNTFSLSPKTLFLGGGQAGFNYEFGGGILVGVEADFDWLSSTASSSNTVVLQNPTGTPTGSTGSVAVNNRFAGDQFAGNTRNIQLLNAGVNYKFGW